MLLYVLSLCFRVGEWEGDGGADVGVDGFTGLCAGAGIVSRDLGECMCIFAFGVVGFTRAIDHMGNR